MNNQTKLAEISPVDTFSKIETPEDRIENAEGTLAFFQGSGEIEYAIRLLASYNFPIVDTTEKFEAFKQELIEELEKEPETLEQGVYRYVKHSNQESELSNLNIRIEGLLKLRAVRSLVNEGEEKAGRYEIIEAFFKSDYPEFKKLKEHGSFEDAWKSLDKKEKAKIIEKALKNYMKRIHYDGRDRDNEIYENDVTVKRGMAEDIIRALPAFIEPEKIQKSTSDSVENVNSSESVDTPNWEKMLKPNIRTYLPMEIGSVAMLRLGEIEVWLEIGSNNDGEYCLHIDGGSTESQRHICLDSNLLLERKILNGNMTVSEEHAILELDKYGRVIIIDDSSSNGTIFIEISKPKANSNENPSSEIIKGSEEPNSKLEKPRVPYKYEASATPMGIDLGEGFGIFLHVENSKLIVDEHYYKKGITKFPQTAQTIQNPGSGEKTYFRRTGNKEVDDNIQFSDLGIEFLPDKKSFLITNYNEEKDIRVL